MDTITVYKFKATCLAALERVRRTGRPLRVTRFGKPLADIVPPAVVAVSRTWLGAMQGRGRAVGDLVEPIVSRDKWNAAGLQLEEEHLPQRIRGRRKQSQMASE
jgi:antitoxin (DNA-binding transcriptional repressor) of toxin-antitoxin stability system